MSIVYTITALVAVQIPRAIIIGQILDISHVQISAHISTEDATRYFSEAPEANGRTWAGIPLQPRAEEIALTFVSR